MSEQQDVERQALAAGPAAHQISRPPEAETALLEIEEGAPKSQTLAHREVGLAARRREAEEQLLSLRRTVGQDLDALAQAGRLVVPAAALLGTAALTSWLFRRLFGRKKRRSKR